MTEYRRKQPEVKSAVRWFKVGDHPEVRGTTDTRSLHCLKWGTPVKDHGWLQSGTTVCPGSWIVEGRNVITVWSNVDFREHFEAVPDGEVRDD
jgi:hypothetical protein